MASLRENRENMERFLVCDYGVRACDSRGRVHREDEDGIRTCFQRDVDRITHSKAFRRLKHKTQVFLQPEGDHYRTRLTHTLEVARLARTVTRALTLNEDLTEAVALGHDLGHTPFGHAGERALAEISACGFRHYEQSLRVVDCIEKSGQGLNLTYETRMGILNHTTGAPDDTREATIVRLCDRIAYVNHDFDDAVRAGIITTEDLPFMVLRRIGDSHSGRIDAIITDLIENSTEGEVKMSPEMTQVFNEFHSFLFEAVYRNPRAKSEESKVRGILAGIWEHYIKDLQLLPEDFRAIAVRDGEERAVCDYISGMTDDYAMYRYSEIFIPAAWHVK